jgi:hypothetical protein
MNIEYNGNSSIDALFTTKNNALGVGVTPQVLEVE